MWRDGGETGWWKGFGHRYYIVCDSAGEAKGFGTTGSGLCLTFSFAGAKLVVAGITLFAIALVRLKVLAPPVVGLR